MYFDPPEIILICWFSVRNSRNSFLIRSNVVSNILMTKFSFSFQYSHYTMAILARCFNLKWNVLSH